MRRLPNIEYLGPLPLGSWLILLNCVIYGVTSRLDRAATLAASKEVYYMYGRLIIAATTLSSSIGAHGAAKKSLAPFLQPKVAWLLTCVCVFDAIYMLSLYKAFTLISPVYVSAIKRGGGVILSSLIGVLFFREPASGLAVPLLAMSSGVIVLCIK